MNPKPEPIPASPDTGSPAPIHPPAPSAPLAPTPISAPLDFVSAPEWKRMLFTPTSRRAHMLGRRVIPALRVLEGEVVAETRERGAAMEEWLAHKIVLRKQKKLYALAVYEEVLEDYVDRGENAEKRSALLRQKQRWIAQLDRECSLHEHSLEALKEAQAELAVAEARRVEATKRVWNLTPVVERNPKRRQEHVVPSKVE
ncbi:hypothetical protein BGZ65_012777, partial [Modicella reniformis]